jgi:hypothetical protein
MSVASRPWVLAGAVVSAVVALVLVRVAVQPIQPYGDGGAAWIEHAVRVELVELADGFEGSKAALLRAAEDHVVSHPVGLHALSAVVGAVTGHEAGGVLWTGLLWMLLLASGVALTVRGLGGERAAVAASFAGACLLPAVHASATRYHYDLPMSALLWLAVGLLLAGRSRPVASSLAAGLLIGLAATVKWTAIPFGALMVLGAALSAWETPRRWRKVAGSSLFAAVGAAATVGPYVAVSTTSFGSTSLASGGLVLPDPGRLLWYPLALILGVLSLGWAATLAPPLVAWWRAGRRGGLLLAVVLVGQLGLMVAIVARPDERFALTAAPALVVVAALGWAAMSRRARRIVAVLAAVVGLLVGLDFHLGPDAPWNHRLRVLPDQGERQPGLIASGLGLGDSFEQRGWARRGAAFEDVDPLREELFGALADCGRGELGYVSGPSDRGDTWWLRYRSALAALDGAPLAPPRRVLAPGTVAGIDFWWLDPDALPDPGPWEERGFSFDRIPDPPPEPPADRAGQDFLLAAMGVERDALGLFAPEVVIARVPLPEGSPVTGWRLAAQVGQVGLFERGAGCAGR